MSPSDRRESDESGEREFELAVDDLNPQGLTADAAERVKGGVNPPTGPIAIPYPNNAPSTRMPGVSTASGTASA